MVDRPEDRPDPDRAPTVGEAEAVAGQTYAVPAARAVARSIAPPIIMVCCGALSARLMSSWSAAGFGFLGHGPSPPSTHLKNLATARPSRIALVARAGLLVSTASGASAASASSVSRMPSYKLSVREEAVVVELEKPCQRAG